MVGQVCVTFHVAALFLLSANSRTFLTDVGHSESDELFGRLILISLKGLQKFEGCYWIPNLIASLFWFFISLWRLMLISTKPAAECSQ